MSVSAEQIRSLREAVVSGEPFGFSVEELVAILDMAAHFYELRELLRRITHGPKRMVAVRKSAEWLKQHDETTPEAPCTANAPGPDPELASHKEATTPASRSSDDRAGTSAATPPGKSKDEARLPAKPAGVPLSRDERECANKLAEASERMVKTFSDHLDLCQPCNINWQSLRRALGQWESVTK